MRWHRIRLGGGAFESASEQQYFVNRISDWIEKRSAALSQLGVSLRTEQAEIYSEWDGDEKVWLADATSKPPPFLTSFQRACRVSRRVGL
jgi:hypothetical protein